jgi:hypothetical protein|tara:strand:+ start:805 stop:987 length:183 start_codon:yes stop_codon:yes gene_type:complete
MQIFNSPTRSFDAAIKSGKLSENENAANYAGNYMYMYHENSAAIFKHIDTRELLSIKGAK